jgi:hypothetical protein
MTTTNFENWSIKLEKVWDLKTEQDCVKFSDLMYSLNGNEDTSYLNKLIDAIRLKDDSGVYESLYNAIWVFPPKLVGQILAKKLPEFQKRMGKFDQVFRFYILIPTTEDALNAFLEVAKHWTIAERRTSLSALKNWFIEDEDWGSVLGKLGMPIAKTKEDPIPEYWDENWRKRFEEGRKKGGEYSISGIFWKKGKKQWLEDLDFLMEVLALNLGKDWRQIDTMTNALWFFAKTTVYPIFIEKLKKLPSEKQTKILDNIKRGNKQKFKQLNKEINGS